MTPARFAIPSAAKLFARLSRHGGWTINPRTGRFVTGPGFVVANPPGAHSFTMLDRAPSEERQRARFAAVLRQCLAANADTLARPGCMLGAWHNASDGLIYLEVSEVFATHADAERVARARGERAIYDLGAGRDIRLDGAA